MIKVHSFLSKILLMSFLLASLVFTACSNVSGGSGSAGELNNGSNDTEKHGYKVTVNWLIPGETETIEETYADNKNKYSFKDLDKTRDGYTLKGFKLEKPTAENFQDRYNYTDYSSYTEITLEKDITIYAVWKNDNYVLKFNEKKYNSDEKNYKTTIVLVSGIRDTFTLPDINKTSGDDICTAWTFKEGKYADDANTTNTLSNLGIYMYNVPAEYDEKDLAICQSYNFYECWYNKSQTTEYKFNKNDCMKSSDLSKCETKTIYMSPYSKKKVEPPDGLFTRTGYTFKGYSADPIATYVYGSTYEKNKTYYAIWEKNEGYISNYVQDYGVSNPKWVRVESDDYYMSDGKFENGDPFFTKSGKTLGGWNFAHKVNSSYADYLPGQKRYSEPSKLDVWYAKWVDITEFNSETLEITFYSDNTKTESFTLTAYNYPKDYRIGTLDSPNCCLVLPECTFEKEGYTFEGWTNGTGTYLYTAGSVAEFDNNPLTSNPLTVNYFTAKWIKN